MSPTVGVVIPTRGDRPRLLRAAVRAVQAQEDPAVPDIVVVVDGGLSPQVVAAQLVEGGIRGLSSEPVAAELAGEGVRGGDDGLSPGAVAAELGGEGVRVVANRFSPGLPGARNTGIAALRTDLVAFCDDDDLWLPGKLAAQLAALDADPGAEFAACAIEVEYGAHRVPRLAGTSRVTRAALTRSRMAMVHSSTFLFRRGSFWVDESAPAGQNEDWDLALRAAARHPIAYVDRPLVRVRWGASAYVTRWADRIAGLEWMLARHPGLAADPRGAARVYGQLAFHNAALGRRREATRWAIRAFAARRGEPRVPIALAVALGVVPAHVVLGLLHTRGHGI
ncbi:glycosyltransferase family 2 protein [Sphaerisporangium fuscum]|uniref:glycosyltransferase family 2 protein n=1 Tax=Sphaerisporangium fuscum TaxID=2835868 RepID=UPI001BDCC432|nr:glycosyltransferase [Sphaerisporangium fuscum]